MFRDLRFRFRDPRKASGWIDRLRGVPAREQPGWAAGGWWGRGLSGAAGDGQSGEHHPVAWANGMNGL